MWIVILSYILADLEFNIFLKETKKLIGNKNFMTNTYRIQACGTIMSGYFCIGFIDFMLKGQKIDRLYNFFYPIDEIRIKWY